MCTDWNEYEVFSASDISFREDLFQNKKSKSNYYRYTARQTN